MHCLIFDAIRHTLAIIENFPSGGNRECKKLSFIIKNVINIYFLNIKIKNAGWWVDGGLTHKPRKSEIQVYLMQSPTGKSYFSHDYITQS